MPLDGKIREFFSWYQRAQGPRTRSQQFEGFAIDSATQRVYDEDGHLHIALNNISKATVNPYRGSEINEAMAGKPGWQPLAADKMYMLLRHPDELAKAADTFNGKPIMWIHKPGDANSHPMEVTIGSTGNDAVFDPPFLRASLNFWPAFASQAIENNDRKELSASYRYNADMTPGTYDGQRYDGVMRDIRGNHVALIPKGRAGPEVAVFDEALEDNQMAGKGKDALIERLAGLKPLVPELRKRYANDADVTDLVDLIDQVRGGGGGGEMPVAGAPPQTDATVPDVGAVLALLEGVVPPEILAQVKQMLSGGEEPPPPAEPPDTSDPAKPPEMPPEDKPPAQDEEEPKDEEKEGKAMDRKGGTAKDSAPITKDELNAAIAAAVKANTDRLNEIRAAERDVEPVIGKIAVACDTAEDVYKLGLEAKGVKLDGVPPVAYKALFQHIPKAAPAAPPKVATDAAAMKTFADDFPNAAKLLPH